MIKKLISVTGKLKTAEGYIEINTSNKRLDGGSVVCVFTIKTKTVGGVLPLETVTVESEAAAEREALRQESNLRRLLTDVANSNNSETSLIDRMKKHGFS